MKRLGHNIRTIKNEFGNCFFEREEEINGALLSILSGENILYLGPPGTGKTLLAKKICDSIEGGEFFYHLLTRFTTPDEIFGPLSIKALENDEFERKTEDYLPSSHIALLDEIFKANSSILNSLLTLINERKFHNGSQVIDVPLLSVFGASNELPEEDENLEALYDRFLFRYDVGYIQNKKNFKSLLYGDSEDFEPSVRITIDQIKMLQEKARKRPVENDVDLIIFELRKQFNESGVFISDRRWKKIFNVLKVAATASGNNTVNRTMTLVIQHMLWDTPEQKEEIKNKVIDLVASGGVDVTSLRESIHNLKEIINDVLDFKFPEKITCYDCEKELYSYRELLEHAKKNQRHTYRYKDDRGRNSPYYNSSEVIRKLKDEKNWTFNSSIPLNKKKLYVKELSDIEENYKQAKENIESEKDKLKQKLNENIWITKHDQALVLQKYDAKVKEIIEIKEELEKIRELLHKEDYLKTEPFGDEIQNSVSGISL